MPFTFVIALLALVVAFVALAVWAFVPYKDGYDTYAKRFDNPYALYTAIGGVAAFVLFLVIASCNIVGTRQVGVVTSFGKPTGETLSNGLHMLAPWKVVNEMDASIQNDIFNGNSRVQVRLGNNSTAQADVNVRWQLKADQADELYMQYKSFDGVKSNLVERNMRTALNEAFIEFDPLSNDPAHNNLADVSKNALDKLRAKAGNQVEILDLSVPVIDYDNKTEERINNVNGAKADYSKAEIEAKTAEQKRKAAEELARQPVPDLKIAIAACVNKMAESGQTLNCYPIGGNVLPTLEVPSPLK